MKKILFIITISIFFQSLTFAQNEDATVYFAGGNLCRTEPWKLVFHDEFNGSSLDNNKWFSYYPYGDNSSDNCSFCRTHDTQLTQQIYRDENVVVNNGTLKLIAKRERSTWMGVTKEFTSGVINSKQIFNTYTKYETRCKIPSGMGFWSAFWIFGWSTEIDVFEMSGHEPDKIHMAIHKWNPNNHTAGSWNHTGVDYSQAFHTYAVEYDPFFVNFFVDGNLIKKVNRYFIAAGNPVTTCNAPPGVYIQEPVYPRFGNEVQVIAGLGIGTDQAPFGIKSPNTATVFPNQMEVDWIRVYQRTPQASLTDLCGARGIEGNSLLCAGQQLTYNFTGVRTDVVTWRTSANLQIVSQTDYSVTVKPINATINGEAWISGTTSAYEPCPEKTFVKNIWVGKPIATVTAEVVECDPCFNLTANSNPLAQATYDWNIQNYTYSNYGCAPRTPYSIPYTLTTSNNCGASTRMSRITTVKTKCGRFIPRIDISPNPAHDIVSLSLLDIEIADIEQCNIVSKDLQTTLSVKITDKRTDIDISNLERGVYYVICVLKDKNEIISKPLIVE